MYPALVKRIARTNVLRVNDPAAHGLAGAAAAPIVSGTPLPECPMHGLDVLASRLPGLLSPLAALFDPEVLQWPGGLGVALLLSLRTMILSMLHSRRHGHV